MPAVSVSQDDAVAVQSFLSDLQQKRHQSQREEQLRGRRREDDDEDDDQKRKKKKKKKKVHKRKKRDRSTHSSSSSSSSKKKQKKQPDGGTDDKVVPPPMQKQSPSKSHSRKRQRERQSSQPSPIYIMAPMVGASERAFRMLGRKYGCHQAYTPMLNAERFAARVAAVQQQQPTAAKSHQEKDNNNNINSMNNDSYPEADVLDQRNDDWLPRAADRATTVVHVAANDPKTFAAAAVAAQTLGCAGCDLNLGCPQRTAFVGHFGSYLMDDQDTIVQMVKAAVEATNKNNNNNNNNIDNNRSGTFPISVKIRLLDTPEATINFCRRLIGQAGGGVARIAVHGRHRASWERTSKSARDGPADMAQMASIAQTLHAEYGSDKCQIIVNGNTISWDDVQSNLDATQPAAGLMSAEGILDNPALFLPRYSSDNNDSNQRVRVWTLQPTPELALEIEALQHKLLKYDKPKNKNDTTTNSKDTTDGDTKKEGKQHAKAARRRQKLQLLRVATLQHTHVPLRTLWDTARDPLKLCHEYLDWVEAFPTAQRTVVFHTRRMCKDALTKYQLLQDCLQAQTVPQIRTLLNKMQHYQNNPAKFVYDREKAATEAAALERRKAEEGKRQNYEARMIRKAKREGRTDLHYYLNQGAALPTAAQWEQYRALPPRRSADLLAVWRERHGQHCLAHHFEASGCPRGRACAFLHADVGSVQNGAGGAGANKNAFVERDEVAG